MSERIRDHLRSNVVGYIAIFLFCMGGTAVALDGTDTPFGRVVAPLEPYRGTFAARLLWHPLPEGWERSPGSVEPCRSTGPLAIPAELFEHRASEVEAQPCPEEGVELCGRKA